MPSFDFLIETPVSTSLRARQVAALFDVPVQEKASLRFKGALPVDEKSWSIGLLVGPSGSGKSTLLRRLFGEEKRLKWRGASVLDDFGAKLTTEEIAAACSAVGFNTIPAWSRPYAVLSNGEKFRVEIARRMLEADGLVVVDEFTSVVDRQVAQICSHAVQKYVRKQEGRQLVAASCHYDIIDWLQPDWIYDTGACEFQWRELQRRPQLRCEIYRTHHAAWRRFAPFHYLTAELHKAAACFELSVEGVPAAFGGVLHRPHARVQDIKGLSRLVTLPDYQGIGLAFMLTDRLGALYRSAGYRFHTYPAHPSLVRNFDRSTLWRLEKRPGRYSGKSGLGGNMGSRPNAVFEYVGPAFEDASLARALVAT